jgi:tripartite-type tricarboxylate transporter receptor subunit TctC
MITRRALLIASAMLATSGGVQAAEWPNGPIRIVVPFAPGASTDIVARQIAPKLGALLGTSVVIDNRGGAGGMIGAQAVATAVPDGLTLLVATTSHSAMPALHDKLPYDTLKDFSPIALIADMPGIIVVHPSLPVKTFLELLSYAKAHPLAFGTAGAGTFPHLGIELLKSRAHIPMTHVPYKGAALALSDTLAGHVQVKLDAYISAAQHIAEGRLRALAVTSTERLPELPDIPTVAESGFPGYEATYWIGIVAPASVPADIRARLEKAFLDALTPENREALAKKGTRTLAQSSKELQALIERELVQWRDLVKSANITAN